MFQFMTLEVQMKNVEWKREGSECYWTKKQIEYFYIHTSKVLQV